ncbi:MAG TPA: transposase [Kofleriaceae bacterium]
MPRTCSTRASRAPSSSSAGATCTRRYFVKALDAGDKRAALPLAAYKRFYKIEDEIRGLDPDAKLAKRRARSKPVWDELVAWCTLRKQHEPLRPRLAASN